MSSRTATIVAVTTAAIGLAIAVLAFDLVGAGGRPAGLSRSRASSSPEAARDAAPASAGEIGSREVVSTEPPPRAVGSVEGPRPVEPGRAAAPRADGIALRGTALYGDTSVPASHIELAFVQGDAWELVEPGPGGAFCTAPIFEPGVVEVRHRRSDANGPHPIELRAAPETVEVAGPPGSAAEVLLRCHPPAGILSVACARLDGTAVSGAEVEVEVLRGDADRTLLRAVAARDGVARLGLDTVGDEVAVGVIARLTEGGAVSLTSDLRRLDTPLVSAALDAPVELVLTEPAAIDVSVTALDGSPAPDRAVIVEGVDPDLRWWTGPVPRTDRAGLASAEGLPPGRYRIRVADATDPTPREIDVSAGERAELRFVLEVARLELAVAGRLIDADGAPLAERGVVVRVQPAGTRHTVPTDDDGRFELRAPPGEGVIVEAGDGLFSDVYEPARLEVPFGAADVAIRRVRDIELREVPFEVVREGTDERVGDLLVMFYRAPFRGDVAFLRAEKGLASPRVPIDESVRLVVEVSGHRRAEIALQALLETLDGAGVGRVEVTPGFAREIGVADLRDGAPLAGAWLAVEGREVARTDAAGRARVDLDQWPEAGIEVSAEGFRTRVWAPREGAGDLAPAWIELEPRD